MRKSIRRVQTGFIFIAGAAAGWGISLYRSEVPATPPVDLPAVEEGIEVLPDSVPAHFAFTQEEIPVGYALMHDPRLLEELGMVGNPDYITSLSEQTALARRGGLCSFAAIYGRGDVPALMLNGVFFRSVASCDRFIEGQEGKELRVAAFRKQVGSGIWALFIACDANLEYSPAELEFLAVTLDRYQRRFALEALYNHFVQEEGNE